MKNSTLFNKIYLAIHNLGVKPCSVNGFLGFSVNYGKSMLFVAKLIKDTKLNLDETTISNISVSGNYVSFNNIEYDYELVTDINKRGRYVLLNNISSGNFNYSNNENTISIKDINNDVICQVSYGAKVNYVTRALKLFDYFMKLSEDKVQRIIEIATE